MLIYSHLIHIQEWAMQINQNLYLWPFLYLKIVPWLPSKSILVFRIRFKMFSLADPSGYRTAWVALRNCLYLLPLGYLAYDCKLLLTGLLIIQSFNLLVMHYILSPHLHACTVFLFKSISLPIIQRKKKHEKVERRGGFTREGHYLVSSPT